MEEIKVDYGELAKAIKQLILLQNQTSFQIHPTTGLINHSRGHMYAQTNQFYQELMMLENHFLDLVRATREALKNAGKEFQDAEKQAIDLMRKESESILRLMKGRDRNGSAEE